MPVLLQSLDVELLLSQHPPLEGPSLLDHHPLLGLQPSIARLYRHGQLQMSIVGDLDILQGVREGIVEDLEARPELV